MEIFIIIWLLFGIIALWREFHTNRKIWYNRTGKDNLKDSTSSLILLLILSPIFISGGLLICLLFEYEGPFSGKERTWYFKIPKDE